MCRRVKKVRLVRMTNGALVRSNKCRALDHWRSNQGATRRHTRYQKCHPNDCASDEDQVAVSLKGRTQSRVTHFTSLWGIEITIRCGIVRGCAPLAQDCLNFELTLESLELFLMKAAGYPYCGTVAILEALLFLQLLFPRDPKSRGRDQAQSMRSDSHGTLK